MPGSDRWRLAVEPQGEAGATEARAAQSEPFLDKATRWAHTAGRGLATGREWIETEGIERRPLTTLSVAFALGVLTGWLVKRR